jgi:hypothetical protein
MSKSLGIYPWRFTSGKKKKMPIKKTREKRCQWLGGAAGGMLNSHRERGEEILHGDQVRWSRISKEA